MKLDFYRGAGGRGAEGRFFLIGWQFGPVMLTADADLEDATDEWDERYGTRVDFETDRRMLLDYIDWPDGREAEATDDDIGRAVEAAMDCGEIRVNSGGTMVWVDHYEWFAEFKTARAAIKAARGN